MRRDALVSSRRAVTTVVIGLLATVSAVVLMLTGWAGVLTWMTLGLGLGCLLVGAAQWSSVRQHDRPQG